MSREPRAGVGAVALPTQKVTVLPPLCATVPVCLEDLVKSLDAPTAASFPGDVLIPLQENADLQPPSRLKNPPLRSDNWDLSGLLPVTKLGLNFIPTFPRFEFTIATLF